MDDITTTAQITINGHDLSPEQVKMALVVFTDFRARLDTEKYLDAAQHSLNLQYIRVLTQMLELMRGKK